MLVIDSKPVREAIEWRHCYCRKQDVSKEWVLCEVCDEWYHCPCVGLTLELAKDAQYRCGYCKDAPPDAQELVWNAEVPLLQGRKRKTVPKPRNVADFTKRKELYNGGGKEYDGPSNWEEMKSLLAAYAKKVNGKAQAKYAKAQLKMASKEHHVNDVAVGGRVETAALTHEMMDTLEGLGELDE